MQELLADRQGRNASMKLGDAIATILKQEGVEYIIGYPVNHLLEHVAKFDIRPIIVRQERVGLHMADAVSRVTSGKTIGIFAMQHGPGTENAYGGVAQAWSESVPILVLPMGYPRRLAWVERNYNASVSMRSITKTAEPITSAKEISNIFRRAFQNLKSGRGGPVLVEIPTDLWNEEFDPKDYIVPQRIRTGTDLSAVAEAAKMLVAAKRPVIYAGQGVHWAEAWTELKELAELLAIPVTTSLEGKSAFPETHPLSLGSGGLAIPQAVRTFLDKSDLIFGIGCSFTETSFGVKMPAGARIIQATLDPGDINKDVPVVLGIAGDAKIVLEAMLAEVRKLHGNKPKDAKAVAKEISDTNEPWLAKWMPKLTSNDAPLNPYRVLWELQKTVDVANTIITHDAGSPRDQLSPFWKAITPLSYIGWGKTTQLGAGLGFAMGAKLAKPDKLCINVWGDAAIGFTGMDFETAVRERIPILSILLNNFSMAIELKVMPVSTEKYRATDISGDYAAMARAFGGYGERVEKPGDIVAAIKRGVAATEKGQPALLEFITSKEVEVSRL
ncbi:thiamine pyrophosphate-requiring protein [Hyphomicrobium sp. CS1BSMeth3]|uniref:thiamine pyrophosphate-requiring protein n=1 Tax=Hyphomicrobium sp. CS1BSMeth3 TaxID=1892844 RepID=UPI0024535232|nr:thiamine pyrophosphate-requiring protein [Hyphomicrobium sp. CS1BSMeth3]